MPEQFDAIRRYVVTSISTSPRAVPAKLRTRKQAAFPNDGPTIAPPRNLFRAYLPVATAPVTRHAAAAGVALPPHIDSELSAQLPTDETIPNLARPREPVVTGSFANDGEAAPPENSREVQRGDVLNAGFEMDARTRSEDHTAKRGGVEAAFASERITTTTGSPQTSTEANQTPVPDRLQADPTIYARSTSEEDRRRGRLGSPVYRIRARHSSARAEGVGIWAKRVS